MILATCARGSRRSAPFTFHLSLFTMLLVVGCRVSLSPVKNRVAVGVESYVVFDADGEEGEGDLYVGSASGGTAFRVTFTRVHESSPALSPDGIMLAFIRGPHAADSGGHRIWVMNLLNGAEREVPELGSGAHPRRLGWSLDGKSLFVRTPDGDFQTSAPPANSPPRAVDQSSQAAADTALAVPLGSPVIAIAQPCEGGICALTASGSQILSATGRDAFRWGADSVGYFRGNEIEVRPLGGGTTRSLRWTGVPPNPRTATSFPGAPTDQNQ
jgi:hypothetical protein